VYFANLLTLCKDWTIENKAKIFPSDRPENLKASFTAFVQYNGSHPVTFQYLRDEYKNAVEGITPPVKEQKAMLDHLGQHLFALYLWDEFPLHGPEGLLDLFYEKTKPEETDFDQGIWASLFEHIGYSLRNTKVLNDSMKQQLLAFVAWRLKARVADELYHFVSWLDADCLDAGWRLETYCKILDLDMPKNARRGLALRRLNHLLPMHADKVLECFLKITQRVDSSNPFYIPEKEIRPILEAGFKSGNGGLKTMANEARENLLRLGQFEFMDMEE